MKITVKGTSRERLRADLSIDKPIGVDREAKVIRGYVVAEEGPFKSGRGRFDRAGLEAIVRKMRSAGPAGVKSHYGHSAPGDGKEGLGKFLGRVKNARIDATGPKAKVRADLHFSESAFSTPDGDLASYVMSLAEEDAGALSSSLDLYAKRQPLSGRNTKDFAEPPAWTPEQILASDVVGVGDAVGEFLTPQDEPSMLTVEVEDDAPTGPSDDYYRNRARLHVWLDPTGSQG